MSGTLKMAWKTALTVGLGLLVNLASADPVAKVELVEGTVFVKKTGGKRSILSMGSALEVGDTINTEKDSYTRLKFVDGSEMSIRPSSALVINQFMFKADKPAEDTASMRLLKGGLRTVTGLVGKRGNEDAYKLNGGTSTIGIRGTEYVARLCQGDCGVSTVDSKKPPVSTAGKGLPVIARIADLTGEVAVLAPTGERQAAERGGPLKSGDKVVVGATGTAALVFADESRVALQPGSEFLLSSVRYTPGKPADGTVGVELVRGGMRMLTGLIGKANPQKVNVSVGVATIGIRGTNFDVVCVPAGALGEAGGGGFACHGGGMVAETRDGAIELKNGGHSLVLAKGEVAHLPDMSKPPVMLRESPPILRQAPAAKPEEIKVDSKQLFGAEGQSHQEGGLYVEVKEGKVVLDQNRAGATRLTLQTGEVGFAALRGGETYKLNEAPKFIQGDAWTKSLRVDPAACRGR